MSGIPVIIVESGGLPVSQVETGAPVMTVADNGLGIPVTLVDNAAPFIVQGVAPPPTPPSWATDPTISGDPIIGSLLTGTDGTLA